MTCDTSAIRAHADGSSSPSLRNPAPSTDFSPEQRSDEADRLLVLLVLASKELAQAHFWLVTEDVLICGECGLYQPSPSEPRHSRLCRAGRVLELHDRLVGLFGAALPANVAEGGAA